jgi:cardiolipin synthase
VRWYNLNRAQNRSHVRAIVIDGRIGYTGGFGIADKWIGDGLRPESWRETSVRFVGPAVMSLQATFSIGWAEASGTLLTGRGFFPAAGFSPAGPRIAGLLHTVPSQGSTSAERFLVLSIAGAARTLYITNSYFVPDDDQRRLLVAAARRGVDVRILTAGRHTDMRSVRLAGRATYGELLRGGVRIYEYSPSMIHAKTMVADGLWSTVGTMNFDNRSATLNEESNLVMMDAGLGARLDSIFVRDLRYSREILLDDFARRPWYDRLLEWGATRMSRVL